MPANTDREKLIQMVMDAPDHKIEQLFRDMGIELNLDIPDHEGSTEMMFRNMFGSCR